MSSLPQGGGPPPGGKMTIDMEQFRQGLARVVQDPQFRGRLDKQPLDVIAELGVTVTEEARAKLAGKSLSDLMAMQGMPGARAELSYAPTASVIESAVIVVAIVVAW